MSPNPLAPTHPFNDKARQEPWCDPLPHGRTLFEYFETLKSGAFEATAALFAEDGVLCPPFEEQIIGREAIAAYLTQEATGMRPLPQQALVEKEEFGKSHYRVGGRVQTALFSVNVAWLFVVNEAAEICWARVKLLASLQELFALDQQRAGWDEGDGAAPRQIEP